MPDYFSHYICARIIYETCPENVKAKILNRTAYMLGAQGGDVFFTYKLSFSENNLGKRLHTGAPALLFEKLSKGDFSYLSGFATHYAIDATLHPFVYSFEESVKSPFAHIRFESDLGLFLSRKYSIPRNILPRESVLAQCYTVYDSMVNVFPNITLTGVERCLKRHFIFTKELIKNKKTSFIFNYNYASLSDVAESAISLGVECVTGLAEGKPCDELFKLSFLEK